MGGHCELGRLRQPLLGVRGQAAGLLGRPRRMLRVAGDAPWSGRLRNGGDVESTRRNSRGGAVKRCILKSISRLAHEWFVRLVFEPPFERLILRVVEG